MSRTNWLAVLAALLVGGIFGSVVIDSNDDGNGHKTRTVKVSIGKAAQPEVDLRDPTPAGVTLDQADDALVTPKGLQAPQPPAGAQNYRCDPNPVRNYSDRSSGVKVSQFVLHYTVSNPGSIDAIRALFNNPAAQVSSHLGLELDGECQLWVPFSKKSWTEGAFNSVSESVEIICCANGPLTRSQWLAAPIIKNGILAQIIRDRARARGIPLKLVDPSGCTPKAGITDHDRLECGNNHVDVGKNFPWDVLLKQLAASERKADNLVSIRRSHRIIHAKIAKTCRGKARHTTRCRVLFARNGRLHAKYGKALS